MNRILSLSLLLIAAGFLASVPAAEPQPPQPWLAPDVQDVIYLGDTRPVLFRLHLRVDGKPCTDHWADYLKRLFDYLDRDSNGFLDEKEAGRMPTAALFQPQYQTSYIQINIPPAPAFRNVDADGDGKVSLEELQRWYRKNGAAPVQLTAIPGVAQQSTFLTDILYQQLDVNKDDKLSRAELESAVQVLRKFDQDDDDLITPAELQNQGPFNPLIRQNPLAMSQPPSPITIPFLLIPQQEPGQQMEQRRQIAQTLLTRYDRNKNGKLSREEIGFPRELFDWIKPGETGEIDSNGLLRWLLGMPDVELTVRVGSLAGNRRGLELIPTGRKQVAPLPLEKVTESLASLRLGRTGISVTRDNAALPTNQPRLVRIDYSQVYLNFFRQLDTAKKGFLTVKQLEGRQGQILKSIMELADRNEDGQLTEKELTDFGEVLSAAPEALTALLFSDGGQGLFELLDTNRDGRLSIRELRQAWTQLREHDLDGDGTVSRAELPRQSQLAVVKGNPNSNALNNRVVVFAKENVRPGNPGPGHRAGPLWFQKMDVNGDGDVSAREFLGSPEDFARIDTDGDGLISLDEAIKAEAWLREKQKSKP